MKKVFVLSLTLLMLLTLAACGGQSSGGGSQGGSQASDGAGDASGGTGSVYWLNFKPEADAALQEIAAAYTAATGVEVKVSTAAQGTYEQTLTAEMDKSGAPTLFVVGNAAAVETWGDYCYDLAGTDVYNQLTTDDFTFYDGNGKVCSIGYCYECFGIIVNEELLERAGHELDEITNFETLKAAAEDIHARAGQLGFDAFTSSGLDSSSSWRFSGHLANMPLYYESVEKGWSQCPPVIEGTYLENFRNIWDLYIHNSAYAPTSLATGGYDAEAEFGRGEAVFYQNGSWVYDNLVNDTAKGYLMDPDDLAMIPIYCGVEGEEEAGLCNGTENCWAVNANASQADIQATLDFMYWMVTSPAGTACMAEQFGEIPYKNAAENPNVFFEDAQEYMEEGKYSVAWTFSYTPNVDAWRAGLVSALTQYCAGGSWEDVETAFVAGWATQYQAANS